MEDLLYDDVERLRVLGFAHELTLMIYNVTNAFPKSEMFGLSSQMRRASVSIGSNIVEGKARGSRKEFSRFLMISRGSLEEVRYQMRLSKDLMYIDEAVFRRLISKSVDVSKTLNGLIKSLNN